MIKPKYRALKRFMKILKTYKFASKLSERVEFLQRGGSFSIRLSRLDRDEEFKPLNELVQIKDKK